MDPGHRTGRAVLGVSCTGGPGPSPCPSRGLVAGQGLAGTPCVPRPHRDRGGVSLGHVRLGLGAFTGAAKAGGHWGRLTGETEAGVGAGVPSWGKTEVGGPSLRGAEAGLGAGGPGAARGEGLVAVVLHHLLGHLRQHALGQGCGRRLRDTGTPEHRAEPRAPDPCIARGRGERRGREGKRWVGEGKRGREGTGEDGRGQEEQRGGDGWERERGDGMGWKGAGESRRAQGRTGGDRKGWEGREEPGEEGGAGRGRPELVTAPLTFLNSRKGTNWTMSRSTGSPLGERSTPSSPSRICMSVKSALPTPTMMMDMGR